MSAASSPSKNIPLPVQNAMWALDALRAKNPAAAKDLEKILTGYALQLHKAGEDISTERLLADAHQGLDFIRQKTDVSLKDRPRTKTYEDVFAKLNKDIYAGKPLQEQLETAVAFGDLDHIKYCQKQGADLFEKEGILLTIAAFEEQIQVMDYLLDNGLDINAENGNALYLSVRTQRQKSIDYLLMRDAQVTSSVAFAAVEAGNFDLLQRYLDQGNTIDYYRTGSDVQKIRVPRRLQGPAMPAAPPDPLEDELTELIHNVVEEMRILKEEGPLSQKYLGVALISEAARRTRIDMIQFLLDKQKIKPEDIEHRRRGMVSTALSHGNTVVLDFLMEHKGDLEPDEYHKKGIDTLQQRCHLWKEATGEDPPPDLQNLDPQFFNKDMFKIVQSLVQKEGAAEFTSNQSIYKLCLFFPTEEKLLRYLEKWGKHGEKEPLACMLQEIFDPLTLAKDCEQHLQNWYEALLQYGHPWLKTAIKCAAVAHTPLKSDDGKNWSAEKTLAFAAKTAFEKSAQHKNLSFLCFKYGAEEEKFNLALDILQKTPPHQKLLPDIVIDGIQFDMDGSKFYRLPSLDIRGLFLGEATDCCQSIHSNAATCAQHGYESQNGGFYVVERKGRIIGMTWAWRGDMGELCFDSIETLGQDKIPEITPEQWFKLLEVFRQELEKHEALDISRFLLGVPGYTAKELKRRLQEKFQETAQVAKPLNYDYEKKYTSAERQILIWDKRKFIP